MFVCRLARCPRGRGLFTAGRSATPILRRAEHLGLSRTAPPARKLAALSAKDEGECVFTPARQQMQNLAAFKQLQMVFFCTSDELLATSFRWKLVRFKETRLERKNVYPNAVIISANVDSASEERNFIGNLFQNKAVCQGIPRIWLRRSSFLSSGGDHWLGLMWRSQWQWAQEINSVICF